jgi:hypothetical protein
MVQQERQHPQSDNANAPSVSLYVHFDRRIEDLKSNIENTRLAMEKRLEGMNEFRAQLNDQTTKLILRSEVEFELMRIKDDIRSLDRSRAEVSGKASQSWVNISLLISVIGLLLSAMRMWNGQSLLP